MSTERNSSRNNGQGRRRRSKLRAFVTTLQVMILLGMGITVGVGLGLFINLSQMLPTMGDFQAPEATIIYSSDGVILGRIFREDRTNVPLKDIPQVMTDATIAIEDSRFYQHSGIDARGIARALWVNLRGHRLKEGGSTITQQLARNVYLNQRKTFQRKLQEAILAILIERNFTKDKILELYLNRIYYGSGAFGVQAASRVYFGKNIDKITLSEAALIAGMPARPSGYSPHENMETAINRRNVVLNKMAELGYITQEERDEAKEQKIKIHPINRGRNSYKAPHFIDYVGKQLRERYGDDVVYGGGLRVYTTLNWKMQEVAEKALVEGVKARKSRNVSQGCFVAIEPASGYVRAMVGSADPSSQFNRCTQGMGQQPGSSFKAFVYTAAFEEGGRKPSDIEIDEPISRDAGSGEMWRPKNYDRRYRGAVTLKRAVAESINIPAIKVSEKIGIRKVIKYAQLMGIKSKLQPYTSTAIGASDVLPIELASAYGTFANNGVYVPPTAITRVTNSQGAIIEDYRPEGRRVISVKANQMMDECLRAVVTQGTGRSVSGIKEARGKTGTTNNDVDAWFIGYVPGKLVAAVWVGNDNNSPMRNASGAGFCAPIWRTFMQTAVPIYDKLYAERDQMAKKQQNVRIEDDLKDERNEPEAAKPREEEKRVEDAANVEPVVSSESEVVTVRICDDSQLLARPGCPSTHTERLLRGTEPVSYCNIHGSGRPEPAGEGRQTASAPEEVTVTVCSESGMLTGPNCPHPVRKRMSVDKVPTRECTLHKRAGIR